MKFLNACFHVFVMFANETCHLVKPPSDSYEQVEAQFPRRNPPARPDLQDNSQQSMALLKYLAAFPWYVLYHHKAAGGDLHIIFSDHYVLYTSHITGVGGGIIPISL